ncbi:membrane protein insertase YidC [Streptococcus jiangjianxini]|uniref:membrane protein insertase YidC n=1 Tax=Streptococcus jiangjianxini TaxID=3161189 RepID=UPI0032EC47BC
MKKSTKKLILSGMAVSMLFFLSGCVRTVNGKPAGFIWDTIGKPMEKVIQYFANDLGLGFGLGIIAVTIIVRLLILPLGLYQSQKAAYQSEKMAFLKPYLGPIQERMKSATTQEEKLAAQADFMAAQRQYGVSMFGGIGCLPLLIQMPFFSALYFAARYTNGIQGSRFLWFSLDKPDLLLTAIIVALYFFQSWLSMATVPEEQRAQMKTAMYSMPLMMAFFGFSSPAGVTLYWFVGGFFAIAQQLITTYIIKPRLRKKVEEEFAKNPPKAFKSTSTSRKDVTPAAKPAQGAIQTKSKRNAGKQRKR